MDNRAFTISRGVLDAQSSISQQKQPIPLERVPQSAKTLGSYLVGFPLMPRCYRNASVRRSKLVGWD